MKDDVKHLVCTCVRCQNTEFIYEKKLRLYKLLPIPNEPWENVYMDFMTQLPKWEGKDPIFCGGGLFFKVGQNGVKFRLK
jgi:hypothetical protein